MRAVLKQEQAPIFLYNFEAISDANSATTRQFPVPPPPQTPPADCSGNAVDGRVVHGAIVQHSQLAWQWLNFTQSQTRCVQDIVGVAHLQYLGLLAASDSRDVSLKKLEADVQAVLVDGGTAVERCKAVVDCSTHVGDVLRALPVHPSLVPAAGDAHADLSASQQAGPAGFGQVPRDGDRRMSLAACLSKVDPGRDVGAEFEALRRLCEDLQLHLGELGQETRDAHAAADAGHVTDPRREGDLAGLVPGVEQGLRGQQTAAEAVFQRCQGVAGKDPMQLTRTEVTQLLGVVHQNLGAFREVEASALGVQRAVASLAQSHAAFCTELRGGLASVVNVQQLIKRVRRKYPVAELQRYVAQADKLRGRASAVLQLPFAYTQTLREIIRRRKFARTYGKLAQHSRQKLDQMRKVEIQTRRRFFNTCGQFLPDWATFRGLDDYPRTCMVKPQPFDTNLPTNITVEDVEEAANTMQQALGADGMAALQPMWDTGVDEPEATPEDAMFSLTDDSERVRELQHQLLALHSECFRLQTEKVQAELQLRAEADNLTRAPTLPGPASPASAGGRAVVRHNGSADTGAEAAAGVTHELDVADGGNFGDVREAATTETGGRVGDRADSANSPGAGPHVHGEECAASDNDGASLSSPSSPSPQLPGATTAQGQEQLRAELAALRQELAQTKSHLAETQADSIRLADNLSDAETKLATLSGEIDSSGERVMPSLSPDPTLASSAATPPVQPPSEAGPAAGGAHAESGSLPNEQRERPHLAFTGAFRPQDIGLFIGWKSVNYVAYQHRARVKHNIVSARSLANINGQGKGLRKQPFVGRIMGITEGVALASNAYDLPAGTTYNVLDVELWEFPDRGN